MKRLVHLAAAFACAAGASALGAQAPAGRGPVRPSLADSFRLGSSGVYCSAQSRGMDPGLKDMFDRGYAVTCRDAAVPVARLYALRRKGDDPLARLEALRRGTATCDAPRPAAVEGLAGAQVARCRTGNADVGYRVYSWSGQGTVYVAEGLAGYDSALTIGLRSIVADRQLPGTIAVAVTEAGDPAAFARVQAGSLSIDQALAEGYRRNNSGDYAEASEFFVSLLQRGGSAGTVEFLVNRALQRSNLGDFAEADALFARAVAMPTRDPVQLRLRRNFLALHLLNQRRLAEAETELSRPIAPIVRTVATPGAPVIDPGTAARLDAEADRGMRFQGGESAALSPEERALILDAQALQLRGTAARLRGRPAEADALLARALAELQTVGGGRLASTTRMRAQIISELAQVAESRNDLPRAERLLREATALLQGEYPASVASRSADARLAAFLARRGRADEALALYREVVAGLTAGGSSPQVRALLAPYFQLLSERIPAQPALVADMFLATEVLIRPGVASTQAVLARELSGGTDEAARLFRQSVSLSRSIERNRVELTRLTAGQPTPEQAERAEAVRRTIDQLAQEQTETQARLADFPRYRALSTQALSLADLQGVLKPDEGYLKLAVVGQSVFALYATSGSATGWRTAIRADQLERSVDALRATVSTVENGQIVTYPYDVKLARELFVGLMEPIAGQLDQIRHLVFEPDGAMLKLPINLLIADQAGVDAYAARQALPDADEFDLTGIQWVGRKVGVTTAVSARAFRDVRQVAPSRARNQYLGLGENAPAGFLAASTARAGDDPDCQWPLSSWSRPISARELFQAQGIMRDGGTEVMTGAAFTDDAIRDRQDLAQYRIIHFATHGLVTAPRPDCPARPALLTSFGGAGSDGLLTFREIYDLRIDADLVVLSACDTAGSASVAATREAGVTSGGGFALDGLVRAFVGAGGRSVIASHWPVPDDFGATAKLVSALFEAPAGTATAEALKGGQLALMDAPETSHPYYWSAFAIVGDGARPVLRN